MATDDTRGATQRRPELEVAMERFSIGQVIDILNVWPEGFTVEHFKKYLNAHPPMVRAVRDLANGYLGQLPEEITAEIRSAIDILDGGDGVIYR